MSNSEQQNHPPNYRKHEPSMEYEKLRRRVRGNTQELWNYVNSELNKLKVKIGVDIPGLVDDITNVIELGAEHKRSLISDIDEMRMEDGYEKWRHDEAKALSDLVQRRLHYLQNPRDCKRARKLVCELRQICGYGCQLHHIVDFFILAYATERTLVLELNDGIYDRNDWEEIFHPISETCQDVYPDLSAITWPGEKDSQVIDLTVLQLRILRPSYLPLSIPADLARRLMRLHGNPIAWWVGQFIKFLTRPNGATYEKLKTKIEELGFQKPIVGVHIRRTDKIGGEAALHSIEKYMSYVEDYFLQLEVNNTNVKRRVFLATDEADVIAKAIKKYPSYEIIFDPDVARNANISARYTDSSLIGIVSDIHMLSLCDYLVCTFSSNVCRAAYEIIQTMYPDASNRFKSLDDIYYYAGQKTHILEAILSHHPRHDDEIHIKPGDQIHVAGNHWDGYSKGRNIRTNEVGLFPSFKVNDKVEIIEFPTYSNVK